jgi:hypothetical protein
VLAAPCGWPTLHDDHAACWSRALEHVFTANVGSVMAVTDGTRRRNANARGQKPAGVCRTILYRSEHERVIVELGHIYVDAEVGNHVVAAAFAQIYCA